MSLSRTAADNKHFYKSLKVLLNPSISAEERLKLEEELCKDPKFYDYLLSNDQVFRQIQNELVNENTKDKKLFDDIKNGEVDNIINGIIQKLQQKVEEPIEKDYREDESAAAARLEPYIELPFLMYKLINTLRNINSSIYHTLIKNEFNKNLNAINFKMIYFVLNEVNLDSSSDFPPFTLGEKLLQLAIILKRSDLLLAVVKKKPSLFHHNVVNKIIDPNDRKDANQWLCKHIIGNELKKDNLQSINLIAASLSNPDLDITQVTEFSSLTIGECLIAYAYKHNNLAFFHSLCSHYPEILNTESLYEISRGLGFEHLAKAFQWLTEEWLKSEINNITSNIDQDEHIYNMHFLLSKSPFLSKPIDLSVMSLDQKNSIGTLLINFAIEKNLDDLLFLMAQQPALGIKEQAQLFEYATNIKNDKLELRLIKYQLLLTLVKYQSEWSEEQLTVIFELAKNNKNAELLSILLAKNPSLYHTNSIKILKFAINNTNAELLTTLLTEVPSLYKSKSVELFKFAINNTNIELLTALLTEVPSLYKLKSAELIKFSEKNKNIKILSSVIKNQTRNDPEEQAKHKWDTQALLNLIELASFHKNSEVLAGILIKIKIPSLVGQNHYFIQIIELLKSFYDENNSDNSSDDNSIKNKVYMGLGLDKNKKLNVHKDKEAIDFFKRVQIELYNQLLCEFKVESHKNLIELFNIDSSVIATMLMNTNCFNLTHSMLENEFGINTPNVSYYPKPLIGSRRTVGNLDNISLINIPDNLFRERYQRIMLVLDQYIESDLLIPPARKKRYLDTIKEQLIKIACSKESNKIKTLEMEKYFLFIYQEVKTNEGWRKSRLRTGLDWIMKSDELLGLTKRYGITMSADDTDTLNRGLLFKILKEVTIKENSNDREQQARLLVKREECVNRFMENSIAIKFLMQLNGVKTKLKWEIDEIKKVTKKINNLLSQSKKSSSPVSLEDLSYALDDVTEVINRNQSLSLRNSNFFSSVPTMSALGNFINNFRKSENLLTTVIIETSDDERQNVMTSSEEDIPEGSLLHPDNLRTLNRPEFS